MTRQIIQVAARVLDTANIVIPEPALPVRRASPYNPEPLEELGDGLIAQSARTGCSDARTSLLERREKVVFNMIFVTNNLQKSEYIYNGRGSFLNSSVDSTTATLNLVQQFICRGSDELQKTSNRKQV